jgi:hypothetical protein
MCIGGAGMQKIAHAFNLLVKVYELGDSNKNFCHEFEPSADDQSQKLVSALNPTRTARIVHDQVNNSFQLMRKKEKLKYEVCQPGFGRLEFKKNWFEYFNKLMPWMKEFFGLKTLFPYVASYGIDSLKRFSEDYKTFLGDPNQFSIV